MRVLPALATLASLLLPTALAFQVEGVLVPSASLPDPLTIGPATRVLVDGGRQSTWLRQDGRFEIFVPVGTWLMEIESKDYIFPKYQIQVSADAEGRESVTTMTLVPGQQWDSTNAKIVKHPLEISPLVKMDFFTPRESFNILSMFASPYMLMMGVTVLMMFVMPKLQAGLDPEGKQELEAETSKMHKQMNSLQTPDFAASLANWMSPAPANPPKSQASSKRK
ncbi:hypothetical protein H4R33_005079 [Dimargaris cristalligena]|uniref:ER membrane protein complex subunit 7 beta-sandwich domain-containing protein n=1 Tax=Dimargaris cristalligena TaxID=215637 RepID=A0A4P9ZTX8_9FUNG|nr:hypothetical protein H4R33_005079 [Dimargaris cristalligena]RKP36985.1 hypothetical protein BJ085DRAFT_38699 [Dimargaris cristalligena]|eukprot:RKP36985.1 hypothetical protein BJ085DRAFT_38699 [Dimargaris cristalligena]